MKIITPFDCDLYLALSGGKDSMFALHFLKSGRRNITCLFFDHGTTSSKDARKFLEKQDINLIIGEISRDKKSDESPEEYWRNERYSFFSRFNDHQIIMAHNLNDQVENWLMTSLHGVPRLIPYRNKNIYRPFIMVSREEIDSYCDRHNVSWIEDKSNTDVRYTRNKIRHEVLPKCLEINPGFLSVVRNRVKKSLKDGFEINF